MQKSYTTIISETEIRRSHEASSVKYAVLRMCSRSRVRIQSWNKSHSCPLSSVRVASEGRARSHRGGENFASGKEAVPFFFEYLVVCIPSSSSSSFLKEACTRLAPAHLPCSRCIPARTYFNINNWRTNFPGPAREWFLADVTAMLLSAIATPRPLSAAKALRFSLFFLFLVVFPPSLLSFSHLPVFLFSLLFYSKFLKSKLKVSLHFFSNINVPSVSLQSKAKLCLIL